MSTWRVEQHYGFGAGRVPIQAEPHRAGRASLREGFAAIGEELTDGGPAASLRRIAGEMPALLLGLLLVFAFVVTLYRDHSDVSGIEVVLLESMPLEPAPAPLLPEPIAEVPEPVVPEPPPVVTPEPPPPQKLAERPKPPPPPPPVEPKPRPRPKPEIPQIARVEPPPAPVPERRERPVRQRPDVAPRPQLKMDALTPTPTPRPTQAPERMERMARAPVERRIAPALSAPAAPTPDLPDGPPPPRAFRVAKAQPSPGERPRAIPGMAPAPPTTTRSAPTPERRMARVATRRPAPPSRSRAPAPVVDALAVAPAAPAPTTPSRRREARPAPAAPSRRAPRPAAAPARAPRVPSAPPPALASRVERATAETPRGSKSDRPGLAGVPLGDLAACVSDREEDRLKQAVVAAVTTQKECVSRAGSYRFVETKNLNAFLMWIDRAPSRVVEDRCGELRHALECLENANRRAAR